MHRLEAYTVATFHLVLTFYTFPKSEEAQKYRIFLSPYYISFTMYRMLTHIDISWPTHEELTLRYNVYVTHNI